MNDVKMIDFILPDFIANDPLLDFILRILLSIFCGLCLGLERKVRKHPVGIRTLVFLSLSSCLLGITSCTMAKNGIMTGDTTRIAAGVVTGVGFLTGSLPPQLSLCLRLLVLPVVMGFTCRF